MPSSRRVPEPKGLDFFCPRNAAKAIGAIIGSIVGLLFLIRLVGRGKPQAGLPLLNGGAIIGFLIAYLVSMT